MKKIIYLPILIVVILISYINVCNATTITLPWSMSFVGCSADTQYPSGASACGTNSTVYTNVNIGACVSTGNEITSAANYPGGAGGRGWRRWMCGGTAGSNTSTTGSMTIDLNNEPEIWVRYYTRFQAGMTSPATWPQGAARYLKLVYIRPFGSGSVFDLSGTDGMTMTTQSGGGIGAGASFSLCSSCGWNTLNPNGASGNNGYNLGDGSWHAIEFHFKNQSGSGTYDGVFDVWMDGVQKSHTTGINWDSSYTAGIASLQFMINQTIVNNPTAMYNDVDDIEISNTGPIGAIRPSPPKNAR